MPAAQVSEDCNSPSDKALGSSKSSQAIDEPSVVIQSSGSTLPAPTEQTRALVANIARIVQSSWPIGSEKAQICRENLQQLIQQGAIAIPAVVEFLGKNGDLDFSPGDARDVGYASLRRALLDVLEQIGGPDAITGVRQLLQTAADPVEIGLLAQELEKLAPGKYRNDIMSAVNGSLDMAAAGELPQSDVGVLFEIIPKYAGDAAVAELEARSSNWRYYAAMSLAALPDGAGLATLSRMAQQNDDTAVSALEMIAVLSVQYPEARTMLMAQARSGAISTEGWMHIASPLSGDEFHFQDSLFDSTVSAVLPEEVKASHVEFGNQNIYTAPALDLFTSDQLRLRLALIDQLSSLTTDPIALNALKHAAEVLHRRYPAVVSVAN